MAKKDSDLTIRCPACGEKLVVENDKANKRLVAYHDCGRNGTRRPVWEMPAGDKNNPPAAPAETQQEE